MQKTRGGSAFNTKSLEHQGWLGLAPSSGLNHGHAAIGAASTLSIPPHINHWMNQYVPVGGDSFHVSGRLKSKVEQVIRSIFQAQDKFLAASSLVDGIRL